MLKILAIVGKTIALLLVLLVVGSFVFRLEILIDLVVKFLTQFSLESMIVLIVSGFLAGTFFVTQVNKAAESAKKKTAKKEEKK